MLTYTAPDIAVCVKHLYTLTALKNRLRHPASPEAYSILLTLHKGEEPLPAGGR